MWWGRGHRERQRACRTTRLSAKTRRRGARTDGLLSGFARHQNPSDPHGSARRKCRWPLLSSWRSIQRLANLFIHFMDLIHNTRLRKQQMKNGGGMISFIMKGGRRGDQSCRGHKIFTLAKSLGGVESLIEVPAAMTHLSVAGSQLDVDPGLVRLSVGIENKDDLLEDIKQALEKA